MFRDSITDTAEDNSEVTINSSSNFLNEGILFAHMGLGFVEPSLLGLVIRMTLVERYFFLFRLLFLKVHIVGENIVLLRFDDFSNQLESVGPAFSKDTNNNLHYFRL